MIRTGMRSTRPGPSEDKQVKERDFRQLNELRYFKLNCSYVIDSLFKN